MAWEDFSRDRTFSARLWATRNSQARRFTTSPPFIDCLMQPQINLLSYLLRLGLRHSEIEHIGADGAPSLLVNPFHIGEGRCCACFRRIDQKPSLLSNERGSHIRLRHSAQHRSTAETNTEIDRPGNPCLLAAPEIRVSLQRCSEPKPTPVLQGDASTEAHLP